VLQLLKRTSHRSSDSRRVRPECTRATQKIIGEKPEWLVSEPTVFIVEDDVDTREMIRRFLQFEGYTVEWAANGKQALERLLSGTPACVILLDLMMPVMDGWEFRRQQVVREPLARIPVIVVSAAGRERIEQVHADDYLSKPLDLEQLLARVSRFCHHA
jgi:CheY-like chemotaxis protein